MKRSRSAGEEDPLPALGDGIRRGVPLEQPKCCQLEGATGAQTEPFRSGGLAHVIRCGNRLERRQLRHFADLHVLQTNWSRSAAEKAVCLVLGYGFAHGVAA